MVVHSSSPMNQPVSNNKNPRIMKMSDTHKNRENNKNLICNLPRCNLHPKEVLVGVCPCCLNDRLLIVAAAAAAAASSNSKSTTGSARKKLKHISSSTASDRSRTFTTTTTTSSTSAFSRPKIFTFGYFLNRLEFGCRKSDDASGNDDEDDHYTSTSLDDSFISIKFEDNGLSPWDQSKPSKDQEDLSSNHKPDWISTKEAEANNYKIENHVVERTKSSHGSSSLRWQKRIGQLFRLIRCMRTISTRKDDELDATRVIRVRSKSWIRNLTRRRATKN